MLINDLLILWGSSETGAVMVGAIYVPTFQFV